MPEISVHSCVTRVPIFATLDAEAQAQVATFARPRRLARGQSLYRQGESVAQLFVVHEGVAKLTHTRADGAQRVVRIVAPGQVIGENAFLTGERPDHSAIAVEPLVACVFDHADLAKLTAQYPLIATAMLRVLSARLTQAEHRLAMISVAEVEERVADYLLDLPGEFTNGQVVVQLPMAKKEIASLLGTTPESFSRVLAKFARKQFITVDGSRIVLHDLAALSKLIG